MSRSATLTVLQLLAARGLGTAGAVFTGDELVSWLGGEFSTTHRRAATKAMVNMELATTAVVHAGPTGREVRYTLTKAGAAAVAEASRGLLVKPARPARPQRPRPPKQHRPDSLVSRLWQLVRMRGMVDSESAARTLCDAGDDEAFARMQTAISHYLKRWSQAGALDVSARRVGAVGQSRGCKRYVLRDDWRASAEPPRWYPAARDARKARKAGQEGQP